MHNNNAKFESQVKGPLVPIMWSRRTALDPKHRPQVPDRPSTTVRREWARAPQEAHILDIGRDRIRRLTPSEVAKIQGFNTEWIGVTGVSPSDTIRALGDAVPPPLSAAVMDALLSKINLQNRTFMEICAGAGGLTSGIHHHALDCRALIENWVPACRILKARCETYKTAIEQRDLRDFQFGKLRHQIGILMGGPPCQPWSRGGTGQGINDRRDILGRVPEILQSTQPEAFVLENVPGLLEPRHDGYFESLMNNLRQPSKTGCLYAVLAGVLNAADFGLPQVRKRLFIIGIRDAYHKDVSEVFDEIDTQRTHRVPMTWKQLKTVITPEDEAVGWMKWPYGRTAMI
jgi:site-specific DNA-cytosine methylase